MLLGDGPIAIHGFVKNRKGKGAEKGKKGKEEGRKEEEKERKGQFEPYLNKSTYIYIYIIITYVYILIYLCIFIFRRLRWHTTASMVCIAVCHLWPHGWSPMASLTPAFF